MSWRGYVCALSVASAMTLCTAGVTAPGGPENRLDGEISNERDSRLSLGGSLFADIARELVARSTTNSQVLSLNLTNLFILVVLKAILFGAGMFSFSFLNKGQSGYGGYAPTGYSAGGIGRSNDDNSASMNPESRSNPYISESEILLALSYLMGDASEKYGCLQRVACEDPKKSKEYLSGAKMLIKGAQFFYKDIPEKYTNVVNRLQEAVEVGSSGSVCEKKFRCASR